MSNAGITVCFRRRALDLYRAKTGTKQHFKVHIVKRVPFGGGMGTLEAFTEVTDTSPSRLPSGKVTESFLIPSLKPG